MTTQNANQTPKISVLVPIYNVEQFLFQALESIATQTFGNFEVLCINDGSTDLSGKIIQAFIDIDPRFRLVDKENSGYGASMNLGIRLARGQYIAILEPDDFYDPNALKKLIEAAETTNADVVKANYWFYWANPKPKNTLISVVPQSVLGRVFKAADDPQIFFSNPSIWSAIYKKSFLLENNLKFLETPGASFQDLGFCFKVWACAQRIFCISDPVVHYRQDNSTSSVNNPNKVFCVCDEFRSIASFIDEDSSRSVLKPYAYRLRYDSYLWNFERLTGALRAKFLPTMVQDLLQGVEAGELNPKLFEHRQLLNLKFILSQPQKFLKMYPQNPTKVQKALYYARISTKC